MRRQDVVVPVAAQEYARALLPRATGGYDTLALRSFQPNFARTNTTVPTGISGHLVYTVDGSEAGYDGAEMDEHGIVYARIAGGGPPAHFGIGGR